MHAIQPEPNNEMPQAASAHDTFWDFVANNQESAHMVMWHNVGPSDSEKLADDGRIRCTHFSFRQCEGKVPFVKFHWKPELGVHSLVWDEAQKISGKDPDFQRRDLWESIEHGNFAE